MNDAGNPIQIDIQSAEINCFETSDANIRYNLGYITGEFTKNITSDNIYVRIWFKRGLGMEWQNIQYRLNKGRKVFRQKLPAGLTVAVFYVQLYGWIAAEEGDLSLNADIAITAFKLSVKEIIIGKFAGEPLGIDTTIDPPPPPVIVPFEMYLDVVGEVQATQARAVWYTTHEATTRVIYGLSPLAMTSVAEDLSFVELHSIILGGLEVNKVHCAQFFSTSKITGETINSDIKSFYTGAELIITNILANPVIDFAHKVKTEMNIANVIRVTENDLTLLPDAEDDLKSAFNYSIHTKVELNMANIIGSEFDTSI